jgi:SOS-response transcriptional repressor LexA
MNLATHSHRQLPLALSLIAAGNAAEITDDYELLDINSLITNGREGYVAFEVTGDSMVDKIPPGSLVFVDSYAEPQNGSIVAVSVNGRTCIKIFKHSGAGLYLVSTNRDYPAKEVTNSDNFHILGVVKAHLGFHT